MTLPDISIPIPALDKILVPELIHPFVIHFAIALPVVIIILEFINLFARRKLLGFISFFFMVLFSVVLLGAYLTGTTDAKLLSSLGGEALETLKQHKMEGIYLFYASLVLIVIKLLSVMVRKVGVKILFILFLLVFSAVLANVALKGTKLVYKYSVVCQKAQASKAVSKQKEPTKKTQTATNSTASNESNSSISKESNSTDSNSSKH